MTSYSAPEVPSGPPRLGKSEHVHAFLHDPVACMREVYARYGTIVRFEKGSVFAFGPDYNRQVLSNAEVFENVGFFPGPRGSAQRRLGRGMFNINGEQHKSQRRLLMPSFRKESLEGYHDCLVAITERTVQSWRVGQTRDMAQEMQEFALRVASKVLFGLEDFDTAYEVGQIFDGWLEMNHIVSVSTCLPIECPAGTYEAMLEQAERLEKCIVALIRQKQERAEWGSDVLSLLLQARLQDRLTDEEVLGQATALFNAAYHTTASALTWTLFLLAQHPRAMTAVVDEARERLHGRPPEAAHLGQLDLLERAIKESMRLLPPVAFSLRSAARPVALGPYAMSARNLVFISLYLTHRWPEIFPEPQRFLPERWLQTNASPYAYLPFGAGPRMCVGAAFAMNLLKIALALIFQRFRLQVVPGARIQRRCSLTLGLEHGLPMRIWRQDGRFSTSPVEGDIHEMVDLPPAVFPAVSAVA